MTYYQGLIDYTRHRTFDFLKVMRYNDSVHNALYALQSTIQRKDESKESLSNANLQLTVERQEGTTDAVSLSAVTGCYGWWRLFLYPGSSSSSD